MESKQPSSILYMALGVVTIGASFLIIYILFVSGIFKVTFSNDAALLLVGIIYGISVFSVITLIYKWHEGPERARAMQSHQMLTIANETVAHLRRGFNADTAEKVAQIIFNRSDADAISITNNRSILSFAGYGQEHHMPGTVLRDRGEEKFEPEGMVIFRNSAEAGCPDKTGINWSGLAVPLRIQRKIIGSLDFFYLTPKKLSQNRITVARGLGELLSTQLELSELDKQQALAVKSELKALRAQINPHFLFNTLNTIAALCRTDPQTARRLIIRFADFFRESLERQSQFTTLDEELKYVDSYLVFEQARFGQKLQIERHIDRSARKEKLPSLVLQPLVENAVKHGMARNGQLHLRLSAKRDDGALLIQVEDDGIGMSVADLSNITDQNGKGLGIGLTNVRDRLRSLYGSASLLNIQSVVGRGTEVTLRIPISGGRV